MNKNCKKCGVEFLISKEDLEFFKKISPNNCEVIPPPNLCHLCRMQRRMSFRNERNLHHRKCDLSGKQIISMYRPDAEITLNLGDLGDGDKKSSISKKLKVYDQSEWWGDKWDAKEFGRTYDPNRLFFQQFQELFAEVPRINLINKEHENSEYCNFAVSNKNSYLCFTVGFTEDCYYSNRILHCQDCVDCSNVINCEICYEVIDSDKCYGSAYLQNCSNCSDCILGYDLRGCRNCFSCYGLQNAQYCIGNKQYSKDEYFKKVEEFLKNFKQVKENYQNHLKSKVHKEINGINFENCTGDNISNSNNCENCYEIQESEDCKFVNNATKLKDCRDIDNNDHSELDYEVVGGESDYNQCFADICWFNKNIYYCSLCFNCEDCFGCVGLKKAKYCILNTQYSKEKYFELLPKIVAKMKADSEYGEFFPMQISPFAYNETIANDFFPLSPKEAAAQSLKWQTEEALENKYRGEEYKVPENINEIDETIFQKILKCETTGRPYKILPKELKILKKFRLPAPQISPDQRHLRRLKMRNKRR